MCVCLSCVGQPLNFSYHYISNSSYRVFSHVDQMQASRPVYQTFIVERVESSHCSIGARSGLDFRDKTPGQFALPMTHHWQSKKSCQKNTLPIPKASHSEKIQNTGHRWKKRYMMQHDRRQRFVQRKRNSLKQIAVYMEINEDNRFTLSKNITDFRLPTKKSQRSLHTNQLPVPWSAPGRDITLLAMTTARCRRLLRGKNLQPSRRLLIPQQSRNRPLSKDLSCFKNPSTHVQRWDLPNFSEPIGKKNRRFGNCIQASW